MAKKWIAINLLLLATAAILGRQLHLSIARFNAENDLSRIQPARDLKQQIAPENSGPKIPPLKRYAPDEFSIIAEKNIFSEIRSKEEKVDTAQPPEPPPLAQKPILVGVLISDTQRTATIIDPTRGSQGQSPRSQVKRIGDYYQGYRITSIEADRIVLESGARKEIIPLHEGTKRTRGGKTPILSTRVVPIGSGATGGAIAVNVVGAASGSSRVAASATAPAPTPGSQPAAAPAATALPRPAAAAQAQTPTPQAPAAKQQPSAAGATDAQGQRIIRTPFGPIVRPNRSD